MHVLCLSYRHSVTKTSLQSSVPVIKHSNSVLNYVCSLLVTYNTNYYSIIGIYVAKLSFQIFHEHPTSRDNLFFAFYYFTVPAMDRYCNPHIMTYFFYWQVYALQLELRDAEECRFPWGHENILEGSHLLRMK